MAQKKEHLQKLFTLVNQVANEPGNEWFKNELISNFGKVQSKIESDIDSDLLPIKKDTETIIDQMSRVTNKFDIIDSVIEQRAFNFYKDFPSTNNVQIELKKVLIKNLELFELSLKKEDHRLASKYLIVQLEGILNLFEQELILWEEANPTRKYSQIKYIKTHFNGSKTMAILAKCSSIQTFLKLNYVGLNRIKLVNDIRDYESHQFSTEKMEESEKKLLQLKNNPNEYYDEVFKLIRQSFISIK